MIKKILAIALAIILLVVIIQIVNAAKYKMAVRVVDDENVLGVNPLADKLDFGDLSRNNGMTRYVALKSSGGTPVYIVVLNLGGIADLVKLNKNYFVLKPGEEFQLAYEIRIPQSAQTKKYSGWSIIFRIPKVL